MKDWIEKQVQEARGVFVGGMPVISEGLAIRLMQEAADKAVQEVLLKLSEAEAKIELLEQQYFYWRAKYQVTAAMSNYYEECLKDLAWAEFTQSKIQGVSMKPEEE